MKIKITFSFKKINHTQRANTGPQDVPITSPFNVPRTSPKDPIWPSWGRPDLTFKRRPNLTFKGRPWVVDSGRPQTWISKNFFKFFFSEIFRTYSNGQIYLKAFQHSRFIENSVKLLRWSMFIVINQWLFS